MAFETKQYYTVDDPANITSAWLITLTDGAGLPAELTQPWQTFTQPFNDIINLNAIAPVIIPGNKILVGTLPADTQEILKLYSWDGDAANLYLLP